MILVYLFQKPAAIILQKIRVDVRRNLNESTRTALLYRNLYPIPSKRNVNFSLDIRNFQEHIWMILIHSEWMASLLLLFKGFSPLIFGHLKDIHCCLHLLYSLLFSCIPLDLTQIQMFAWDSRWLSWWGIGFYRPGVWGRVDSHPFSPTHTDCLGPKVAIPCSGLIS